MGFAKSFVIFIFIAGIVGYGTKSWNNFWLLLGIFAVVRFIWKLTTN
jgi:hypothetical protein